MRGIRRILGHDCAWGAFRSPCWSELIKIFGIVGKAWSQDEALLLVRSNSRPHTFKCMRQENPGSHQTHQCRHSVNHRNCPLRPRQQKTRAALHSQKHFLIANPNRIRARLPSNRCVIVERSTVCSCTATIDSPRRLLPISAVFGMRYRCAGSRGDGIGARGEQLLV
jgi:hypothetical protein